MWPRLVAFSGVLVWAQLQVSRIPLRQLWWAKATVPVAVKWLGESPFRLERLGDISPAPMSLRTGLGCRREAEGNTFGVEATSDRTLLGLSFVHHR